MVDEVSAWEGFAQPTERKAEGPAPVDRRRPVEERALSEALILAGLSGDRAKRAVRHDELALLEENLAAELRRAEKGSAEDILAKLGAINTDAARIAGLIDDVNDKVATEVARLDGYDADLTISFEKQIGSVRATLEQSYYTIAEADQAIAAVQTNLDTEIAGVNATLSTTYYTRAATDAAISLATTNLQAAMEAPGGSIGSLQADLTNNYYTEAQTDAAISAATLTLQTELESPTGSIGLIEADLTNNYYTRSAADSAIAAATSTLQSSMEGPSGSIGLLTANLDTNYYTITEADTAIATATTNLQSALEGPSGSIGQIQADLTQNYVTNSDLASSNASFETSLVATYITPLQNSLSSTDASVASNASSIASQSAALANLNSELVTTNNALNAVTATANQALSTSSTNDTAIASLESELNVDVNGNIAGINNFGNVMANFRSETQAEQVLKVFSSGSSAEIRLTAISDDVSSSSAIEFNADNVIINGSIITPNLSDGSVVPRDFTFDAGSVFINTDLPTDLMSPSQYTVVDTGIYNVPVLLTFQFYYTRNTETDVHLYRLIRDGIVMFAKRLPAGFTSGLVTESFVDRTPGTGAKQYYLQGYRDTNTNNGCTWQEITLLGVAYLR